MKNLIKKYDFLIFGIPFLAVVIYAAYQLIVSQANVF